MGIDDTVIFQHPPGSRVTMNGTIITPHSDGVAVDEALLRLWQWADGRSLADLYTLCLFANEPALAAKLTALRLAGLLLPPLTLPPISPGLPAVLPLVSVVVVTHNGLVHLQECLTSLAAQTYSNLELIMVDDRSTDGTEAWVREHFPQATFIHQQGGPNFAAACNLGAASANGEWLLMLNNDTLLEPTCVAALVEMGMKYESVGGVAALLRFYRNRAFVNGLGTYIPPRGYGYDLGIGNLDVGQFAEITETPLLCFGAALISRQAWEQVGPLDVAYRFYYEDADWSYRARCAGFKLVAAPQAWVYHKFSASLGVMPTPFKIRCVTRNRLRFVRKLLPRQSARRRLWRYVQEDMAHFVLYLLHRPALAWAIVRGWIEAVLQTSEIASLRHKLPSPPFDPDQLDAMAMSIGSPQLQGTIPCLTTELIEEQYGPYLTSGSVGRGRRQRLLIISPDAIDVNMGGVGVRYWELAHVLAEHAQVTLATPGDTALSPDSFRLRVYTSGLPETLQPLVADADMVLVSGFIVYHHPFLRHLKHFIIVDLYDPTTLENLERFATRSLEEQQALYQVGVATYNELFALGDFFICASEKQRDYWLGGLTAAGRTTPDVYAADPTLRRLIDTVPFGLQEQAPQHTRLVLKGVYPGIESDAKVILWGGGLWDWLDPLTLIDAMPQVLMQVPQARLFFMGTQHPNPDVPSPQMVKRVRERAATLGLLDRVVFFNDWVEYAQRANYLLEADVGVSLHGDHIETRFAFRTRVMDYIWAGLPMVVSGGDVLSDWVANAGLGQVVAPGDVEGVAQSLIMLLQNPVDRGRFAPLAEQFHWSQVAYPLIRYVRAPWRNGVRVLSAIVSSPVVSTTPVWRLPQKALKAFHSGGLTQLRRAIQEYLTWRFS